MKPRQILKIVIDILMTALLLLLMAYHLTGQQAHERLGAGMSALFIAHNRSTIGGTLFKGKYTAYRVLQMAVNLLVFLSMLCQLVSGSFSPNMCLLSCLFPATPTLDGRCICWAPTGALR